MGMPFLGAEELHPAGRHRGGAADALGAAQGRRAAATDRGIRGIGHAPARSDGMTIAMRGAGRRRARARSRARHPDGTGFVERGGVRSRLRGLRRGRPDRSCSMPTWSIIHSRLWKLQIPYLAAVPRVVTFDGRGNGRSDRPTDPEAYAERGIRRRRRSRCMDATGDGAGGARLAVDGRRTVAAPRGGAPRARRADRLHRSGRAAGPGRAPCRRGTASSRSRATRTRAGRSRTATSGSSDYPDFLEFFFAQCLTEPHSTKPLEDTVGWGLETDAETLVATAAGAPPPRRSGRASAPVPDRLPDPRHPRQRRPRAPVRIGCAARGAGDRARSPSSRGRATSPMPATRCAVNLLLRDFIGHRSGADDDGDGSLAPDRRPPTPPGPSSPRAPASPRHPTASGSPTRSTARATRRSSSCHRPRSSTRASGRARSPT